jgi:hypothetical protein
MHCSRYFNVLQTVPYSNSISVFRSYFIAWETPDRIEELFLPKGCRFPPRRNNGPHVPKFYRRRAHDGSRRIPWPPTAHYSCFRLAPATRCRRLPWRTAVRVCSVSVRRLTLSAQNVDFEGRGRFLCDSALRNGAVQLPMQRDLVTRTISALDPDPAWVRRTQVVGVHPGCLATRCRELSKISLLLWRPAGRRC